MILRMFWLMIGGMVTGLGLGALFFGHDPRWMSWGALLAGVGMFNVLISGQSLIRRVFDVISGHRAVTNI